MLFVAISQLGHSAVCFLFGALALWQARASAGGIRRHGLAIASGCTAIWAISVAMLGSYSVIPQVLESLRNLTWLGFMLTLLHGGRGNGTRTGKAIIALYSVLGIVLLFQIAIDLTQPALRPGSEGAKALFYAATLLRMMLAVGALMLVHNLYTAATPEARWGIKLPMIVLASMWFYDLNLYTVSYLGDRPSDELLALRGPMMVLLAPVLALGSRRNTEWKMRLSRKVTFQSLSLIALGSYLSMMALLARTLDLVGYGYLQLAQITLMAGMTVIAVILIPSQRLQRWLKVTLVKHLFQHRYDYRAEWMRFMDTLGQSGVNNSPLETRVVKAIADIPECPGGLLLTPDGNGGLCSGLRWHWHNLDSPTQAGGPAFIQHLQRTGRILEFDALRQGQESLAGEAAFVPDWILADQRIWVGVPLVHFDRLVGLVLLERPSINRMLDWEDFDLLRIAGRQVASYLAEARSQEVLSDVKRFDEFNRRFAFIMHDIKNLVSQLSLVVRNAERHADNPEFRADMMATLRGSVGKLNDLLARLSQHGNVRGEEPRPIALRSMIDSIAKTKRPLYPIEVEGQSDLLIMADPQRLEQAISHLIQNAIDASTNGRPIRLIVDGYGLEGRIVIADEGSGMSAEFIRDQLFRPFASTKEGGFGVGAFEARALVTSMRGRMDVESAEGKGTRFTILLPLAPASEFELLQRIAS